MASGICKSVISVGGRDKTLPCYISIYTLLSLSKAVPVYMGKYIQEIYEYFLYYDTPNLIRKLYKVFGDL